MEEFDLKQLGERFENRIAILESQMPKLANFGWTIDGHWDFFMIDKVLQFNNKQQLDQFLYKEYYACEDKQEVKRLSKAILKYESLSLWKPLIEECNKAYQHGMYRICIPSLISVIEGIVGKKINDKKTIGLEALSKKLKEEINKLPSHSVRRLCVISIKCWYDKVFELIKFSSERSLVINRNWIMHGRDDCNLWKEIDAIRLYSTIYMLGSILK